MKIRSVIKIGERKCVRLEAPLKLIIWYSVIQFERMLKGEG